MTFDDGIRAERAEAVDAVLIAESLAAQSWPTAGGHLVITGDGFYVNRAMGVAIGEAIREVDVELVERECRRVGQPPEIEASPWADPSLLAIAGARGFRTEWFRSILVQPLPTATTATTAPDDPDEPVEIAPVRTDADFGTWRGVAIAGFGITTRRAAEVVGEWGAALRRLGEPDRLLIARLGGTPVGVASLGVQDGVALLGGMTTDPAARNQGVQRALVAYRLRRAEELGCSMAASTTAPGGVSERNLRRAGFDIAGTKVGLVRS